MTVVSEVAERRENMHYFNNNKEKRILDNLDE